MLERERPSVGCPATVVATVLFFFNTGLLAGGAMFGAFAVYFWAQELAPLSLGMTDVTMVLAALGGAMGASAIVGMFVATENSRLLAKFYSLIIVAMVVGQSVAGVYVMLLQGQVNSRIQSAWINTDRTHQGLIEHRLVCCGLNAVGESPDCVASKSQVCGPLLLNLQAPIYNLLATMCWALTALQVVNLLMAQFLSDRYKKYAQARRDSKALSMRPLRLPPSAVALDLTSPTSPPTASRHQLPESFRNNPPLSPPPMSLRPSK